jgi:hypothetical protein
MEWHKVSDEKDNANPESSSLVGLDRVVSILVTNSEPKKNADSITRVGVSRRGFAGLAGPSTRTPKGLDPIDLTTPRI